MAEARATLVLAVDQLRPDPGALREAARVIGEGGVAVFPTETVYGIGGDAGREDVIARIVRIKGRDADKPLARLVGGWSGLDSLDWAPAHLRLARELWPGPLTLVLKTRSGRSVGYRWPDHPLSLGLLETFGRALVATSANRAGSPPVIDGQEASRLFRGEVDLVLVGGRTAGVASTVVDLSVAPPRLLRAGPVGREKIEEILGEKLV